MTISFTKMHALGNDFVVINALVPANWQQKLLIAELADRHRGIGFDQLLLIEPSTTADFFCRIFNADGSEAEQCGNGLRCVARFIHEKKLCAENTFTIATKAGSFPIVIQDYDHIRIAMGAPSLQAQTIPLKNNLTMHAADLGNPHAIIEVTNIDDISFAELSKEIFHQAIFPNGVNIGLMQIITPEHIRLRTLERGVGETFACGSNACAAVCVGIANKMLAPKVKIELRYGNLLIEWAGDNAPIYMTGPATSVFEGTTWEVTEKYHDLIN